MQGKESNTFSHPPSVEELMAVCAVDCNDPRSPHYKRDIVRPKVSPIGISLRVIALLTVCALGAYIVYMLVDRMLPAVLSFVGILLLLIFVFSKRILISLIKIYQAVAPESVRKRCRYEPSCSAYMILAVEKYGFWRGLIKGLRRWSSCKPPNGGYDLP